MKLLPLVSIHCGKDLYPARRYLCMQMSHFQIPWERVTGSTVPAALASLIHENDSGSSGGTTLGHSVTIRTQVRTIQA